MVKVVMKLAAYVAIIIFTLVSNVASRRLSYDAPELVSDGVSNANVAREEESFLRLKEDSSEEQCELMYGFLPCSTNIPSHLFLIVIYEYLLYHAESYAGGDGRIFRFLGKNFFVLSLSQLLDSLPDALVLLATGLSSSKEKAQEYVVTGAGLLAGSSILLLTLLWGICFICSRKKFYVAPGSEVQNQWIQLLTGSGVLTDPETCFHAKVMFYSLIPFAVILLPSVFGVSYSSQEYEIVLLVSLSVSLICLFSYFIYQLSDSRIQDRRREYAEVEQKVEMHVPFYDVQALMLDREKHLMSRQKELEKTLTDPATCEERKTNKEFYAQFENWLDGTIQLMDDPYSLDTKGTADYNEVVELLLKDRSELVNVISKMMERVSGEKLLSDDGTLNLSAIDSFFRYINKNNSGTITFTELEKFIMGEETLVDVQVAEIIMAHLDKDGDRGINKKEFESGIEKLVISHNLHKLSLASTRVVDLISKMMECASGEKLLRDDGTQDPSAIDRFFRCVDVDNNGSFTATELRNFIMREEMPVDVEVAYIIMRHLDAVGNKVIDKEEFESVIKKLLNPRQDDRYHRGEAKAKAAEKYKAIILLIIGIFMLTFLAEPLVESVRKFSDSVKIEPFYVSFILVPLATNARTAIAAIRAAKQKRLHTTSLTFSEIYHKVFMNNILGFFVLVSVIYFRGLTWHFSAEVLVVIIVCIIMGLLVSFKSKFPNWTLLIAFPLYPLSLVVVYFVNDAFQFT